jgi:glycosyltransferase involved in cell wall biosynthesis
MAWRLSLMHVCLLSAGEFPPDARIAAAGTALRAGGHAVTVCARGTGGPDHDIADGIDVRRLPDAELYSGPQGVLDGVRYALGFVQPAWVRAASEVDDELAIDVCCVTDLALLKTGLEVGERLDVPVVCDFPSATAAIETDEDARGGRLRRYARRVFHSPWRRNRLLEKRLHDVDKLTTTCEEARAEYVRETDIDPERVAVVRETVNADLAATVEPAHGLGFDVESAFVATVVAEGVEQESLETLVAAAARAADSAANLRILVVGDIGEGTLDDLERLARRKLAGGRIVFRTEDEDTAGYLAASDVCVLPECSHAADATVPRALFAALALGVPVVAHETPPLRRLLGLTGAGLCVQRDETAFTEALVELSGAERRAELGANGRAAVNGVLNRERDAERLRELYESLLTTPQPDITIPQADS